MDTYSSEYLRILPIENRKKYISQCCQEYVHTILTAAGNGLTYYIINTQNPKGCNGHSSLNWQNTPPTNEEIIEFLKTKFPDAKISYEEKWVCTTADKQELKKGIYIDWSS